MNTKRKGDNEVHENGKGAGKGKQEGQFSSEMDREGKSRGKSVGERRERNKLKAKGSYAEKVKSNRDQGRIEKEEERAGC